MRKDPLTPLWMERQAKVRAGLEKDSPTFLGTLDADWAQLKREEAEVRVKLAAGTAGFDWPRNVEIRHTVGHWRDQTASRFDIHDTAAFGFLPSVQAHGRRASVVAHAAGVSAERLHSQEVFQWYHIKHWERYGRKVLLLDSGTWDLLRRTELPKMPLSFLNFPYQSFYLVFPQDSGFMFSVAIDATLQPVEGVFVTVSDTDGAGDKSREMSILVCGKNPKKAEDDNFAFATIGLGPDGLVTEVALPGFVEHRKLPVGSEEIASLPHLIIGTLLYLQSEHPALEPVPAASRLPVDKIKNTAKRRQIEKRNEKFSQYGYIHIGGGNDAVDEEGGEDGVAKKTWSLSHEVWVRGHFKHQPFGEGGVQRKIIWIRPYRKGPDVAEALARRSRLPKAQKKS